MFELHKNRIKQLSANTLSSHCVSLRAYFDEQGLPFPWHGHDRLRSASLCNSSGKEATHQTLQHTLPRVAPALEFEFSKQFMGRVARIPNAQLKLGLSHDLFCITSSAVDHVHVLHAAEPITTSQASKKRRGPDIVSDFYREEGEASIRS